MNANETKRRTVLKACVAAAALGHGEATVGALDEAVDCFGYSEFEYGADGYDGVVRDRRA